MSLTSLLAVLLATSVAGGQKSPALVASRDGKVKIHVPKGWIVADKSRKDYRTNLKNFPMLRRKAFEAAAADRSVSISLFDADPKRATNPAGDYFNVVVIDSAQPTQQRIKELMADKDLALDKMLPWQSKPSTDVFSVRGFPAGLFYGHLKDMPAMHNQKISLDALSLTVSRQPKGFIITLTTFPGQAKSRIDFVKGVAKDILASTPSRG